MDFLNICLILISFISVCYGLACNKVDECSCTFDDGSGTIDLTSLGNSDGTARFGNMVAPDQWVYDVNVCYPFNQGTVCFNAAACQSKQDGTESYLIGDASSTAFSVDALNTVTVSYSSVDGTGLTRTSNIQLTCDSSATVPTMDANGEVGSGTYTFVLTSICACPNGCGNAPPPPNTTPKNGGKGGGGGSDGGIGIGTILCIVVLVLAVTYAVTGMAYMKVRHKATGKEIIPNAGFWSSMPGLVKDGVLFLVGKCRGTSYNKI